VPRDYLGQQCTMLNATLTWPSTYLGSLHLASDSYTRQMNPRQEQGN